MQNATQSKASIVLTPDLFALIDEAALIDQEIKHLNEALDKVKTRIKAQGAGDYEGFMFKAKVTQAAPIERTDWKAVAMRLNPSYQLIAAHTSISAPVVSVRFSKI